MAFGAERVAAGAPLAPLTTFKVGGPADWLVTARTAGEIVRAVALAREYSVPLTVIGGGSNLLVADEGVRGLVVRIHGGDVRAIDEMTVRADAGVTINGLVRWTIARGMAGLEAWAGTPGTVGGAIYGNAHFQGRNISELVKSVTLVDRSGQITHAGAAAMGFAYDYSRLHATGEIVTSARFAVTMGDTSRLRETARASLTFRKHTQPLHLPSAGCIFQNPGPDDVLPAGVPASAGALVDRAGLKGAGVGGAVVSAVHANFIVAQGPTTATDIRALIEQCREAVASRFGVHLRDEIVYLGDWTADSQQGQG
jgi:UDP-N-acetylmuramate dehydrogenase